MPVFRAGPERTAIVTTSLPARFPIVCRSLHDTAGGRRESTLSMAGTERIEPLPSPASNGRTQSAGRGMPGPRRSPHIAPEKSCGVGISCLRITLGSITTYQTRRRVSLNAKLLEVRGDQVREDLARTLLEHHAMNHQTGILILTHLHVDSLGVGRWIVGDTRTSGLRHLSEPFDQEEIETQERRNVHDS